MVLRKIAAKRICTAERARHLHWWRITFYIWTSLQQCLFFIIGTAAVQFDWLTNNLVAGLFKAS